MGLLLVIDRRKTGWFFTALDGGRVVATMEALPVGPDCLIHNQVQVWSKESFKAYLALFRECRQILKSCGVRYLVTGSGFCDEKMRRYWEMMGFTIFGHVLRDGVPVPFAVMEVSHG